MKVKIINKSKHPIPSYQTTGSAGMDITASLTESITLKSMERKLIPTDIYIGLPKGFEAQIRSRSGMAYKRGLSVVNGVGTIDSDYIGMVMVAIINLSLEEQVINDGDRIAQMIIAKYEKISWDQVDELEETERGAGGFGSTGQDTLLKNNIQKEQLIEEYFKFMETYPIELLSKPIDKEAHYKYNSIILERIKLENKIIPFYKNEKEWNNDMWERTNKKEKMNEYLIKLQSSFLEIKNEVETAKNKYKNDFNSFHEAYAVILEEVDELWEEIKKKEVDKDKIKKEAVQVGAMISRLLVELL